MLDAELNLAKAEPQCNCAGTAGSTDRVVSGGADRLVKWGTDVGASLSRSVAVGGSEKLAECEGR